ncbi:zinc finger MYM-type protein 1-like, partial [Tachysurus ichikawai]
MVSESSLQTRDKGGQQDTTLGTSSSLPPQDASAASVICATSAGARIASAPLSTSASASRVDSPVDLSSVDEPATQPVLRYPVTVIGDKARSFSTNWYSRYNFLEYSIRKDAVFCKVCRHFGERGREEKFSQTGYRDWKHLNHACLKHQNSKSHTFALDKCNNYRLSLSERGSVIHQLNNIDGRQGEITERNREHIKVILDVLITCAKQEVPLRGNRENDEVKNAGNFLEFYRFVCRHDKATQE